MMNGTHTCGSFGLSIPQMLHTVLWELNRAPKSCINRGVFNGDGQLHAKGSEAKRIKLACQF